MYSEHSRNTMGVAALALPVLALLAMTASASIQRNTGDKIWEVRISGYDPRDLLFGHYLTYRYDWNIAGGSTNVPANQTCLCLHGTASMKGGHIPKTTVMDCRAAASCDSILKAWPMTGGYTLSADNSPGAYYIPEDHARPLDALLRDPSHDLRIELMAHKDRTASIRTLLIDGKPMAEYLQTHGGTRP